MEITDDEGFYDKLNPGTFIPISLEEYVPLLLKDNPHADAEKVTESLKHFVSLKKERVKCKICESVIWAIGSALAGSPMCFSCITGEAMANDEYEIDEVCY